MSRTKDRLELLQIAAKRGITAGAGFFMTFKETPEYTQLVVLDHHTEEPYLCITKEVEYEES